METKQTATFTEATDLLTLHQRISELEDKLNELNTKRLRDIEEVLLNFDTFCLFGSAICRGNDTATEEPIDLTDVEYYFEEGREKVKKFYAQHWPDSK